MGHYRMSEEDFKLMGGYNGMGRSFLRRQVSKAAPVFRKVGHNVLQVAAKVPLTAGFVKAARVADKYALDAAKSKLSRGFTKKKSGAKSEEGAAETESQAAGMSTGAKVGLGILAVGILGGIGYAATRK